MTRFALLVIMLATIPKSFAEEEPKAPTEALKQKLVGTWIGRGPCDGLLTLDSNGAYERKAFGPVGMSVSGKWSLSWTSLPPTLCLNRAPSIQSSQNPETYRWAVTKLNDTKLTLSPLNSNNKAGQPDLESIKAKFRSFIPTTFKK